MERAGDEGRMHREGRNHRQSTGHRVETLTDSVAPRPTFDPRAR